MIELPVELVGDDGSLSIDLRNAHAASSGARIIVSSERIEVLHADGSFARLLALALALVVLQLLFLAAVGVCGAAIFRLPIAALVGAVIFLVGLISPYFDESLAALVTESRDHTHTHADGHALGDAHEGPDVWTTCVVWVLEGVLQLLPDLSGDDPLRPVVESRSIAWSDVAWRYGGSMIVRGLVLLVIASWFWRRRELGAVT